MRLSPTPGENKAGGRQSWQGMLNDEARLQGTAAPCPTKTKALAVATMAAQQHAAQQQVMHHASTAAHHPSSASLSTRTAWRHTLHIRAVPTWWLAEVNHQVERQLLQETHDIFIKKWVPALSPMVSNQPVITAQVPAKCAQQPWTHNMPTSCLMSHFCCHTANLNKTVK